MACSVCGSRCKGDTCAGCSTDRGNVKMHGVPADNDSLDEHPEEEV